MGGAMARRLLEAGFELTVYDTNKEAVQSVVKVGGKAARNLMEVAEFSDFVITSLPNDAVVEAVYLDENGLIAGGRKGQVFIEMSTITHHTSRKIAKIAEEKGIDWLDAPVFGGPPLCGKWTLPVGGKEEVLAKSRRILETMAERIFLMGGPGCGHITKVCNNILTGVNMASVSEIMTLAAKLGVDPRKVQEAIANSPSAGNSTTLSKYFEWTLKRDFKPRFYLDLMYKDLDIGMTLSRECKMPLLLGSAALQAFEIARAKGLGRDNVNAIIKVYEEWSQVEVKG